MTGAITTWIQTRVPISGNQLREFTNEPVPNHLKRWWFCLGGTPAYLFMVQIVTGILLAFYYKPSSETAYQSVRFITEEASYGWFIRSVHKWGATLMVASVILHQMRVYFTGAYRFPREINWMVGMLILICVLLTGFTGYSLVYEQLSFWGATVGSNITASVPIIGEPLKRLMLGGFEYNSHTLSRFFILHGAVLPVTIFMLLAIHITLIRLQGVTQFNAEDKDKGSFSFFPDHLYSEIIMGLTLMIILSALATIFPAAMGAVADPLVTPELIKPEWYFYATFRWLKFFSGTMAILTLTFIVFIMFLWPFIDAGIRKHTRAKEASVWIGIAAVFAIIGLTVWEAAVAH